MIEFSDFCQYVICQFISIVLSFIRILASSVEKLYAVEGILVIFTFDVGTLDLNSVAIQVHCVRKSMITPIFI